MNTKYLVKLKGETAILINKTKLKKGKLFCELVNHIANWSNNFSKSDFFCKWVHLKCELK